MDIEKEKYTPCNEKNSVKEVTRRILKMDGNSLTLAVGFLICILFFIAPVVTSYAISCFLSPENIFYGLLGLISALVMLGGSVFLFLPSIAGYMNLARDTANGKRNVLFGLLYIYRGPKKYFMSMLCSALSIAYAAFTALVFIGGFVQLKACVTMVGASEVILLIPFWLCSFIAAVFVFAYISSYLFFVPYLYLDGRKLKDALRMSVGASRTCRAQIIKLEFSYLFNLLLGILTFGVLLVIRSAPKISVSYFVFGNRVFNKMPYEE